jgi:hypothetical protein
MKATISFIFALVLFAAAAYAGFKRFEVKASEYDPGKTHLVQGTWLEGIGCPTAARTELPNESFTGPGGEGSAFTDPACPTADPKDRKVEGLLLAKTGPTANFASAFARIENVKGETLTELGWDIRKPGTELSAGARGSHCGAGAPRWNITARNPVTGEEGSFFVGCNSPPAPMQMAGVGYVRMRWGGAAPLLAFPAGANPPCTVTAAGVCNIRNFEVRSLAIVFDEGYDTAPDNFGLAILDNIDVNGVLVGTGSTDAD